MNRMRIQISGRVADQHALEATLESLFGDNCKVQGGKRQTIQLAIKVRTLEELLERLQMLQIGLRQASTSRPASRLNRLQILLGD